MSLFKRVLDFESRLRTLSDNNIEFQFDFESQKMDGSEHGRRR